MGTLVVPTSAPYAYGAAGAQLPDGRVVAVGASGSNSATESLRFSGTPVELQRRRARAVDPPGRRLLLLRQRGRRPARRARAVGGRRHRAARQPGDGARCARARPARSTARGTATGSRSRAPTTGRSRPTCCSTPRAARWPPATRPSGSVHDFALARFDGAGALDRGFGAGGMVLTSFPGTTMARATAIAQQADGKLVVAGIACTAGSGPQCSGGTARLALARYEVAASPPAAEAEARRRPARASRATRASSRCPPA